MIGFSKLLNGKATISAALRAEQCGSLPPHLLQFSTVKRPIVVWNMTRRCNLRCRHCYLEAGEGDYGDELTTLQARQLIEELAEMKVPVLLFSGGEPLLRKDIWELAGYASSKGVRPGLSTNGTLITPEVATRIKQSGFAYVGISIDGRPETHDNFRDVPNSFSRALDGIRNVQDAGLNAGVRFTVNRDNYQDLPFLLDFVEKEGIRRFCLYHLVYAGRGKELAEKDLTLEQKRELVNFLIEQTNLLRQKGVDVEILTTDHHADGVYLYRWAFEHLPERAEEVKKLLEFHGGCSAGVKMVNVDPEGYVYPCQFWRSGYLGKFPEKKFQEIWSDENNTLIQALRNKTDYLKGKCGRCKHNAICGGCRIRAEALTGDVWEEDPACYLTEEEITSPI